MENYFDWKQSNTDGIVRQSSKDEYTARAKLNASILGYESTKDGKKLRKDLEKVNNNVQRKSLVFDDDEFPALSESVV